MAKVDFVVIGAGLPRTGTTSTKTALEILYPGKCFHMDSILQGDKKTRDFWSTALEDQLKTGKKILSDEDWINFLEGNGFSAGVDFPISLFYKELMRIFPNAKVVLTVRDNPEAWYRSVKETIYVATGLRNKFDTGMFQKLIGMYEPITVAERTGRQPIKGFQKGLFGAIEDGLEESTKLYNHWVEEVKATVPKERLLIFNVKQGWKPLCDFLEVPIPANNQPYPHVNDAQHFQTIIRAMKVGGFVLVYVLPLIFAGLGYYFSEKIATFLPFFN